MQNASSAGAEKKRLRLMVRQRVAALSPIERARADQRIAERLRRLAQDLGVGTVIGYSALPDEARIDDFLEDVARGGGRVLMPCIVAAQIELRVWSPGCAMSRDEKGVLAPEDAERIDDVLMGPSSSLVVVPGRAFDRAGTRLGRGGGYYDRLLSAWTTTSMQPSLRVVGVAYEAQIVDRIPREGHDCPVALLVTEDRTEATAG